ncbi:MAG: molybdopterin-dependent oxidoreductase, partial [Geminicoccaceae bacterium]
MLRKKSNGAVNGSRMSTVLAGLTGGTLDRRAFLHRSGLTAGGVAAASWLGGGMVTKATAQTAAAGGVQQIKSVCTHCSVGCTVIAEVENGVWIGQEPGWDSPFNLGAHCAKGASVREHGHGERRLKYPMKMVDGRYQRISWEEAINEVGDKLLEIIETNGPDAVYWMG